MKKLILSNKFFLNFFSVIYSLKSILLISGRSGNIIKLKHAFLRNTKIIAKKRNNKVCILSGSHLVNSYIYIYMAKIIGL